MPQIRRFFKFQTQKNTDLKQIIVKILFTIICSVKISLQFFSNLRICGIHFFVKLFVGNRNLLFMDFVVRIYVAKRKPASWRATSSGTPIIKVFKDDLNILFGQE